MIPLRFLTAPTVLLFLGSSLLAQTIDAKGMLEGLQAIKQKQSASAKQQLAQTIADFTAASSDDGAALNFYIEAVRVTRFVGRVDADSAFSLWKKALVPRLNPSAIRTALRYTTITLQRAAGATDDQIFPVLLQYAQETQDDLPSLLARPQPPQNVPVGMQRSERRAERNAEGGLADGAVDIQQDPGERIMEQDVTENIFTRWYNIADQLSGLQNWANVPSDIDGMYKNFLLPYMRKNRDPRVLDYWDNRIITDRGAASQATAEFSVDRYNMTTRPALLWSRAEDEIVIGRRDQGITDMYGLVKAFPTHPDAGKWITELEGLLRTPPAVAATGSSPTTPQ
jgi:hypothetical protein